MTISEAVTVLHQPSAYGGFYGAKYGQALSIAFECMSVCVSMGNCNDCNNAECGYKPKWGEKVRYNCSFYKRRAENGD